MNSMNTSLLSADGLTHLWRGVPLAATAARGAIVEAWTVESLCQPIDYGENLLGERFLERGGVVAIVAPSGVGKSSTSVQMAILWALGRPAFHIAPAEPLSVLVVQNEDSENDAKGPFQGVLQSYGLTSDDIAELGERLNLRRLTGARGTSAALEMSAMIDETCPDLLIVNPLNAFTPGKQGEETEVFLRECLQPLATEQHIGILAVHHTPKLGRQNGVGTGKDEYTRQYNGAGTAEVANALRGIINIAPVGSGIFRFTADKRGRKIGWRWEGKPTIERYFRHCSNPDNADLIWWEDAAPEDVQKAAKGGGYQDLLTILPKFGETPISRERIHELAKGTLQVGNGKADDMLKLCIEDGLVHIHKGRSDTNRITAGFTRAADVREVVE